MKEVLVFYWPIALSVAWPVAFILVWSGPFGLAFFGAPLVLMFWAVSAAVALAVAVGLAIERSWLRSLAMLTLPLTAFVAGLNLEFVWRAGQEAGEYVHFLVMYPTYLSEISRLPTDQPRLMVHNWGGLLLTSHGVVYDESDEITLPKLKRSEAWNKRASRTDTECVYAYTPVGGHFYFVGFC
jgi:hypothetical protein